jgi:hypothetical protein
MQRTGPVEVESEAGVARQRAVRPRAWFRHRLDTSIASESGRWTMMWLALLPFTLEDFREFENPIRDFGAASAYPINDTVTNMPTIIKAPSITDEEHEEVTRLVRTSKWMRRMFHAKDLFRSMMAMMVMFVLVQLLPLTL